MKTAAVVLARMNSTRCPGKPLRDLAGKPLIDWVVDRARRIRSANEIVVATTTADADDVLAEHCRSVGVAVFRGPALDSAGAAERLRSRRDRRASLGPLCQGPADNVAKRILDCADARGWSHFARINADCPFLDPELIDTGMERLVNDVFDLVTNIEPRSYPYGIAVEVFRTNAFRRAYRWMTHADDLEHVSRYFYRHRAQFRTGRLPAADDNYSDIRLTVDTEHDLQRAAVLIQRLGPACESSSWPQIVAAYRACWPTDSEQPVQVARV